MNKEGSDARPVEVEESEDRVDEYAISMFGGMGYTGRLPDGLVYIYKKIKGKKDRIRPAKLSPECLAIIAALYEMSAAEED